MHLLRFTLIVLSMLFACIANSQKNYNNWYFGDLAAVTFNTDPPTALTGSQMSTGEGSVSISNNDGNLLFYSDGVTVWDREHHIMSHGKGLTGDWSTKNN